VDSVSAGDVPYAAISGIGLRPQRLQRRRCQDSETLDRKRLVRRGSHSSGGSSKIELGVTPSHPVILRWETFTDAANEAGISRRYGGIHFRAAALAGRLLGRLVAFEAWQKAQEYFQGVPESSTTVLSKANVSSTP
jgi:hypothetical protein